MILLEGLRICQSNSIFPPTYNINLFQAERPIAVRQFGHVICAVTSAQRSGNVARQLVVERFYNALTMRISLRGTLKRRKACPPTGSVSRASTRVGNIKIRNVQLRVNRAK